MSPDRYEVIVVDDGSQTPVDVTIDGLQLSLVRLEGVERSAARNAGAKQARAGLLVFLDDDMTVGPDFLAQHEAAHDAGESLIVVGAVRLPPESLSSPFCRFRQELERQGVPVTRGIFNSAAFCTAQNMSISKAAFNNLGGFNRDVVSGEDQELALRHLSQGGLIAYLPEAQATHHDTAMDIRSYCRRCEWGAEHLLPFATLHPGYGPNAERRNVLGPPHPSDSLVLRMKKRLRMAAGATSVLRVLFALTDILERGASTSRLLTTMYRFLIGIHLTRGYRKAAAGELSAIP